MCSFTQKRKGGFTPMKDEKGKDSFTPMKDEKGKDSSASLKDEGHPRRPSRALVRPPAPGPRSALGSGGRSRAGLGPRDPGGAAAAKKPIE